MVVKQLPFVQGVFVRLPEFAGGCRPIIPRPEPGGGAEIRIEGRELDGALHGATFVVFDRHHEIVKFIQVTDVILDAPASGNFSLLNIPRRGDWRGRHHCGHSHGPGQDRAHGFGHKHKWYPFGVKARY